MSSLITLPLDIPNINVLKAETTATGDYVITVASTLASTPCRQCGRDLHKVHGYDRAILLRHLPILGQRVYLQIQPKRFECSACANHPTTTQQLAWYDPRCAHTTAYTCGAVLP